MSYDLGDLILIQGEFRDPETAGSPRIDPATVKFKVKTPSAVTTSYVYGTDDEVVRSSLGVYTMNISADEAETWFYRIESTGTAQAAAEGTFDVKASSTDGSGGGGGGGGASDFAIGETASRDDDIVAAYDIDAGAEITPLDPTKPTIVTARFQAGGTAGIVAIGSYNGYAGSRQVIGTTSAVMLNCIFAAGETYSIGRDGGNATLTHLYERTLG